jgi:hypothetical protein
MCSHGVTLNKGLEMSEYAINNIRVSHNGRQISLAQHWIGDRLMVQEVAAIPHGEQDWEIELFGDSLDSLIDTLVLLRAKLNEGN